MMKKSLITVCILLFSCSTFIYAQTQKKAAHSKHVVYADNIDAPLTVKELQQIKEVYGTETEKLILNNPQRLKDLKNILRHRVEILELPGKKLSSFRNLSSVPLNRNFNLSLQRDLSFNKTTFNPLKYQFAFFSKESTTVRVDNTQYLIVIKSQFE
ncbi:hypothetical protein RM697_13235 [Ichthyenterobacterium sp. W332]|uniref:Uncharacterized protein n=1 Tax=Microcosmobacter mediterraneus TaxID=3075607 RepID=A0ABU2YNI3_9FLAO|nr:hypothetical protein [Ichthyenterobacterium sp. W332]MDT0559617.1 hypothetical protein [Ichthyenterobacterium sp. W332]